MDSYMVTSFWIHMLCLHITSALTRGQNKRKQIHKVVAAAFFCTVFDMILMIIVVNLGISTPLLPVVPLIASGEFWIAARIAYGKHEKVKNGLRLLCVTALMAGLFQLFPVRNVGLFCLAGTILLPVLSGGIISVFRAKQTRQWIYEARLCQKEEEKSFSAFMDTGNRLRLYGSNLPVVLVDEAYLNEWIKAAESAMPQKLVFLPYKGVGGKGLLRGVRLRLKLIVEDGMMINGEVAAVAAEHRLFQGCEYQMILQPEVLTMAGATRAREGVHNVI